MGFQYLPQVHSRGDADRVKNNIYRCSVGKEGHIFRRRYYGDDSLVTMPPGQLIAYRNSALLGNPDLHPLVDAGGQVVAVLAGEDLDVNHLAPLAVRHAQRGVLYLSGFLTEDSPQQFLLRRELGLALGGNLTHQYVVGPHFGPDPHDAFVVQLAQALLADIGYIAGNLFRAQLGIASFHLVFLDVNRGELVLLYQAVAEDNCVLKVIAFPAHKGAGHVLPQRQLPVFGGGAIGQNLPRLHPVALAHYRLLVDAGALVGADEFHQRVDVVIAVIGGDHNLGTGHRGHHSGVPGEEHLSAVLGDLYFHARGHYRCLGPEQGHRLPLHVGAHQGAVGVVMLQEGYQGGGDADYLLG
ncbi:hypothetical protein ES703_50285 [subsurface metagenome]